MDHNMLAQAQQISAQVLSNITADQLELPTPCAKWNVAELIDHTVGAQHWARCAMQGAEMETGDGSAQGDFVAAFNAAATQAVDAFAEEGALDKMVNPGFGDMPARALLGLALTDTFTHAWDLAKATGQDTNLAPPMAEALLQASKQSIQDSFRSEEGAIFGLEQEAPEGASAADRLAAFLGRTV
jgi:uncharacterized protein (TIGR03086 family)